MLIYGLLFGLTLQLGIGPVNIATWVVGVERGWRSSLKVSLGVAFADFIYITLAFILRGLLVERYIGILSLISALFLLYLGVKSLRSGTNAGVVSLNGSLIKAGFILNIVNPKAIVMWLSLISTLEASYIFTLGIPLSTVIWLGLLPIVFNLLQADKILKPVLRHRNVLMGCIFILYGCVGMYRGIVAVL